LLADLEQKLGEIIERVLEGSKGEAASNGVFLRLSTRSPKDASLMGEESTVRLVAEALRPYKKEANGETTTELRAGSKQL